MALLFIEGFDAYGTTDNVTPSGMDRKWSGVTSFVRVQAGRVGGKSVSLNFGEHIETAVPATQTLVVGFGFNAKTANQAESRVVEFREGTNVGINLRRQVNGKWSIYMDNTHLATTYEWTGYDTWCYVELRVKVDNSAGEYELRVNGNTLLSGTGDTQAGSNAWTDGIRLVASNVSGALQYYDDLYVGTSLLGPVKVETIFPTADNTVACTPSTGVDNYALVDDNPSNDDTDYVTGGSTDSDLYNYGSIDSDTIFGVAINTICRETDASPFDIKQAANSGLSAAESISSTSYVTRSAIFETNPNTGIAWTNSEVNAAQFGFEVQ